MKVETEKVTSTLEKVTQKSVALARSHGTFTSDRTSLIYRMPDAGIHMLMGNDDDMPWNDWLVIRHEGSAVLTVLDLETEPNLIFFKQGEWINYLFSEAE